MLNKRQETDRCRQNISSKGAHLILKAWEAYCLDEWKRGIWGGLRGAARSMLQTNLMLQDSRKQVEPFSGTTLCDSLMASVAKTPPGAARNSFWLQRLPACIASIRLRARVKMQFCLCPDSSLDYLCVFSFFLFFFAEVVHKLKGTEFFRQTLASPGLWYGTHLSSLSFGHLLVLQLWRSYLTLCYFYSIHEVRTMIPMDQAYCGH